MPVFYRWFADLCNLLFPELCLGCNTGLHYGESLLCTKCIHSLPYTDHHLYPDNRVCRQFWGRLPEPSAMALLYFKKGGIVQQMIHHLKYNHQKKLGYFLGKLAAGKLLSSAEYKNIDFIIPVPLNRKRLHQRGYNQSECIAAGISEVMNIPLSTKHLLRIRKTSSQTKKNRYQRHENMRSVFSICNETDLSNKHILLVDDVITTGATLEACALELIHCGIKKISIVAMAFAE